MLKDGTFFRIEAFMRNDLNLRGNELMTYALIYGFQRATGKPFDGTQDFISEWVGISRRSVVSVLTNLENQGFIKSTKSKHGYTHQKSYICIHNFLDNSRKNQKRCEETSHPRCEETSQLNVKKLHNQLCKNFTIKCEETSHNTDSNTDNNNIIHTYSVGRTEFSTSYPQFDESFKILQAMTKNRNQLFKPETKRAFDDCVKNLDNDFAGYELVYAWYLHQTDLESQGRLTSYMPNLKKWLTNDAVYKVREIRTNKWYSRSKIEKVINGLKTEYEIRQ